MQVETIDDIIRLIKCRDNLSIKEARIIVEDCLEELRHAIKTESSLYEIEDIVKDYLGLEPDYLDILFTEIM